MDVAYVTTNMFVHEICSVLYLFFIVRNFPLFVFSLLIPRTESSVIKITQQKRFFHSVANVNSWKQLQLS